MLKPALLIIDVQIGAFDGEKISPIENSNELLSCIEKLINKFRNERMPIVYVQDCGQVGGAFEKGSKHWPIHPKIKPRDEDILILKEYGNAFEETKLKSILDNLKVRKIYITGLHSEKCVSSTFLEAINLGYKITIAKQGHSTISKDNINFREKISAQNLFFKENGAEVKDLSEIVDTLL